ncbi:MAG: very short patch repair endonuclease [Acidobacteriaceae bacterium]
MDRNRLMSSVRSKNTRPEMIVRRLVHSMGYRYRLHQSDLPGKPDLVFRKIHKVIFVHGCFWHRHECRASLTPRSNTLYWLPKLERNKSRDAEHLKKLRKEGWKCLVLWECKLENIERLRRTVTNFLT